MKQNLFENKNDKFWQGIEDKLLSGNKSQLLKTGKVQFDVNFPEQYRMLCHHLSLARSRHYSLALVNRLENLVSLSHQVFYYRKTHFITTIFKYLTGGFAKAVRSELRWVVLSSLLFFGSLIAMFVVVQVQADMVYMMLDGQQLSEIESMYQPGQDRIGRDRQSDTDFRMFGFYIFNNTSIGLRTFASGLVFGIGTLFILLFNGLFIGTIAGHLTSLGYTMTFWPFVAGHSAMELTAIMLSGAAGLKIGYSIIHPGRKSRLRALQDETRAAMLIMYGVIVMFLLAAFIEAYWSSITSINPQIKYAVGIGLWIFTILYFSFAGRKT